MTRVEVWFERYIWASIAVSLSLGHVITVMDSLGLPRIMTSLDYGQ